MTQYSFKQYDSILLPIKTWINKLPLSTSLSFVLNELIVMVNLAAREFEIVYLKRF